MKYCYNCSRITLGEPLFCNFCGRSYEVKLCPRLHPNPRAAQTCSQCGSRDLSAPQPKIPFWLKPLVSLVSVLPGLVLLAVSVLFLGAFVQVMLTDPAMQSRMMVLGLLLALLWYLYMKLPLFLRRAIHRLISKTSSDERQRHR
jgi:hypothetical protein